MTSWAAPIQWAGIHPPICKTLFNDIMICMNQYPLEMSNLQTPALLAPLFLYLFLLGFNVGSVEITGLNVMRRLYLCRIWPCVFHRWMRWLTLGMLPHSAGPAFRWWHGLPWLPNKHPSALGFPTLVLLAQNVLMKYQTRRISLIRLISMSLLLWWFQKNLGLGSAIVGHTWVLMRTVYTRV